MRQATETPAAKIPEEKTSMHVYKTRHSNISFTVSDKSTGEPIAGLLILIKDSMGILKQGKQTDINGQCLFTDTAMFPPFGNIDFNFTGYVSLGVTKWRPQAGDSIAVHLIPFNEFDTLIIDYFPPPINDPFAPQNKTIRRDEIRRMPK